MILDLPLPYISRFSGKENTDTQADRLGRCYELAGHAQLNFALLAWITTLVHGTIGPQKIPHAWVEFRIDNKRYVWDPVIDEVSTGVHLFKKMEYREWTRYGPWEAAANHVKTEHYGPWGSRDNDRYDREVARIQALQKEMCTPDCKDFNHDDSCAWRISTIPEALL